MPGRHQIASQCNSRSNNQPEFEKVTESVHYGNWFRVHKRVFSTGAGRSVSSFVVINVCSQVLLELWETFQSVSKDLGLHTSTALSLPRPSPSKRCWTGIISTSLGNNTIIDTYFSCFWAENSNSWHLVLFCSYENQTSGGSSCYCCERDKWVTVSSSTQIWGPDM